MAQTKETTTKTDAKEIKEIKAMLAEIIEKNNRLEAENEKLRAKVPTKELTQTDIEAREWLEEEVPLYLFKDSGKYKDDVTVPFNGKNWRIQRGVEVMVPRYIYNIVMESQAQQDILDARIAALEEEFQNKSKG